MDSRDTTAVCVLVLMLVMVDFSQVNGKTKEEELLGEEGVICAKSLQAAEAKATLQATLNVNDIVNPAMDGDQLLTLPQCEKMLRRLSSQSSRKKRQAYNWGSNPARKWQGGSLAYYFTPGITEEHRQIIRNAMAYIAAETCIEFYEIYDSQPDSEDHISFEMSTSCVSFVGKATLPGRPGQSIILTEKCIEQSGEILHLLCQTLGLWHMHQRNDRNTYVTINRNNVKETEAGQFSQLDPSILITQGLPYDYHSLMHFSGTKHQKPGRGNTIRTTDPRFQSTIGQRVELSFYDARHLNLMYCKDTCVGVSVSAPCKHGGYQDPRDCTKCKCPDGWYGDDCADLEPAEDAECGGTLVASLNEMSIRSPGYNPPLSTLYEPGQECTWIIETPNGEALRWRFIGDFGIVTVGTTCFHWLEYRDEDEDEPGPRICGNERPTETFESSRGRVMFLFRTNYTYEVDDSDTVGFHIGYWFEEEDKCKHVRCLNGGTCDSRTGTCDCPPGFRGGTCAEEEDACESRPCQNGGTCVNDYPDFICQCREGYTGVKCQDELQTGSCSPNPCRNRGTCEEQNNGDYVCQCPLGWQGKNCGQRCGGCGGTVGTLVVPCTKEPTSGSQVQSVCYDWRTTYTRTRVFYFFWKTVEKRVRVQVPCANAQASECCTNSRLITYRDTDYCAVQGWTDWSGCSEDCGGCGRKVRYLKQMSTYRTRRGQHFGWRTCGVETADCNMQPCDGCLFFHCERCCSGRGYIYSRREDRCIRC